MSPIFPISAVDPRFRLYTAAAEQVEFAVPFPWQNNADIAVWRIRLGGEQVELNEAEHYQLTGAGSINGGTLTLTEGNEAIEGEQFLILGDTQLTRIGSIVQGGRYRSRSADDDFDRMVLIAQEIHRELGRALRMPYGAPAAELEIGADNTVLVWRDGRLAPGPLWDEDLSTIAGPGVATGGSAGFLLAKVSGVDFDTEWIDPAGFATAAQGALAETAVQPGDLGGAAGLDVGTTEGTVAAGDDERIVKALQADAEDQEITGGARVHPKDLGNLSGATITPDPGDRPIQKVTNNGAGSILPGSNEGQYTLLVVNASGAGAITTTGWTLKGDSFDTTTTSRFACSCLVTSDVKLMTVVKVA